MDQKFLNARSPLRLLEKSLHGGLGRGNLGVVLAGHGVGKAAFLVNVAIDDLLRGDRVLHVALDQTVGHVRAFYDTVFDDLASSTQLRNLQVAHADADRRRSIRTYPAASFGASKLREAVKVDSEAAGPPAVVIVEGWNLEGASRDELADVKALAGEIGAEIWLSHHCPGEKVEGIPPSLDKLGDLVSVVLALEPESGTVGLRALKDHDNPDVSALRVSLDPRTLLLVRS
jgi:hypothetical protein